MEFRVLGSFGGDSPECRMTSFLIDGAVAIDAGAITRALTIPEQRAIRHVVITHTHMDHTASLPFLIENIFGANEEPVSIYCTEKVLAGVRRHLFNNDTWPDFSRIPNRLYPSLRFESIDPESPFVITGLAGGIWRSPPFRCITWCPPPASCCARPTGAPCSPPTPAPPVASGR